MVNHTSSVYDTQIDNLFGEIQDTKLIGHALYNSLLQDISLYRVALQQMIFNKKARRFSQEAATNLLVVGEYFIKEQFTYIRVFGSTTDPHIPPIYVYNKLLARASSYQIVGKDLTKVLKDGKKSLWPTFCIKCDSFALANIVHATKESTQMESIKLHTLPTTQFDPNNVAYNVTTGLKLKTYNHGEITLRICCSQQFLSRKHLNGQRRT